MLDSLQSRKSAGRGAPVAAVPAGLEPEMHFEVGKTAKSPLSMEQPVPADLDWTIKKQVELRGEIDAWRERQFERLVQWADADLNLNDRLNEMRSATSIACSSHVHLNRLSLIIQAIKWPDKNLVADVIEGFKPLGPGTHRDLQGEVFVAPIPN